MKVVSEEYFCDICKNKIENNLKKKMSPDSIAESVFDFNIPPNSLEFKYGTGTQLIFEHMCSECSTKIINFINDLIKLK